jgi:hypothetical protein
MMKKLLLVLALFPTLAFAQHYHHHGFQGPHWRYQGDRWYWMVPAIVGGVVVYEATKPSQPIVIQQTVPQETCTAWTEIQQPDGKIYRERTCTK